MWQPHLQFRIACRGISVAEGSATARNSQASRRTHRLSQQRHQRRPAECAHLQHRSDTRIPDERSRNLSFFSGFLGTRRKQSKQSPFAAFLAAFQTPSRGLCGRTNIGARSRPASGIWAMPDARVASSLASGSLGGRKEVGTTTGASRSAEGTPLAGEQQGTTTITLNSTSSSIPDPTSPPPTPLLPPTSPSIDEPVVSPRDLRWSPAPPFTPSIYLALSKSKLSAFVVLTAMAGYALSPGSLTVSTLLITTVGTALCSASANTINQWAEQPYDAQMARTRTRTLVKHAASPLHAFSAGIGAGVAGTALLFTYVNPLTASLGLANILLYTCVYTPLKRVSIANTWAGAIVGAIPPLMGWAAATNSISPVTDSGAYILALILYAWQFPHFNSLAWNLRPDYSKAGYRMMSVTDPALNARVALRYAASLFPISYLATYTGLATTWFALDSTLVNAGLLIPAIAFWKRPDDKSARTLFFASLVHLPVLLILLMVHKTPEQEGDEGGEKAWSWDGVWRMLGI
ncbi:UbiA prenyltransferase family-domain-containing protein [Fimicolochytrium jonesii]|uniref:UbiA prenyltransferase family-domain-containing protein n=1 Tax=Fimicolochytrium jonesii TaxID=1396493 RepID=UPI0022FDBCEA|nr:UbiA prenyltransferase family-domain-containing protein [Fimicolochytrium jonesii]KAI8816855.1 UbiA prenyltransferase family-domain-containing protein [Fimicolochytrium jonesii]